MRRPLGRGLRSATGPADLPTNLQVGAEADVLGPGDPRTPASWSVPHGVRTASEWAWRVIVISVAVALVLFLASVLSEVVIPVIVALLLSALLHPVYDRLVRVVPRGAAAGLTVLGTIAVVAGMLSFVGSQLTSQLGDITTKVGDGIDQIRAWVQSSFGITDTQLSDYIDRARETLSSGSIGDSLTAAGLTFGHLVAGFFVALFTLFFFLYDGPAIWVWAVRLFPRRARASAHASGLIAWGQLAAFTRATIFVALADAVGIGLGALILGVPFASGIALLVFFGAFIPIVGAAVSGSVAVLLALVALGPVKALVMLAIVIGVQQLEAHVLQPLLIGRAMRLHPLAVILAIAAGIILAGIIGGLIAVPAVAVLNAVGHHLLDSPDGLGAQDLERPTVDDVLEPDEKQAADNAAAADAPDGAVAPDVGRDDHRA